MSYMRLITHGIHMFMPFLEAIAVRLVANRPSWPA
jgi:hypothetical protein